MYLTEGQAYQSVKKYVSQFQREEDPVRRLRLYENMQKYKPLIHEIELEILRYAQELRTFRDRHVLEGIRLLRETYQTEDRGVIYEHKSSDPVASALARPIREMLEGKRTDSESVLRVSDLINCLEVVESDVRYHQGHQTGDGSYLTFIRRNHPDIPLPSQHQGLILP